MDKPASKDKRFCECGCGVIIDKFAYYSRGKDRPNQFVKVERKFKRGHNWAKKRALESINEIRFCACGCGETIKRYFCGRHCEERRFKKGHSSTLFKKGQNIGDKNNNWKGGRFLDKDGYVMVKNPDSNTRHGYTQEHVLLMEKHLGRKLVIDEIVHHINGVKDDNRLENLMLMTKAQHVSYHSKLNWQNNMLFKKKSRKG